MNGVILKVGSMCEKERKTDQWYKKIRNDSDKTFFVNTILGKATLKIKGVIIGIVFAYRDV